MRSISRRQALALGAGSVALTVMGPGALHAAPKDAEAEIMKFTGGKTPEKGKIAIELPEIAENGNTVPLTFTVDSPMTEQDHITDVIVLADGNPRRSTSRRCPARPRPRRVSASPPPRTSSSSPRPRAVSSSPSRSS